MEIKQNGSDLIVTHKGAAIVIHNHPDGLSVINISGKNTAVHMRKEDRDSYLFTNAQPICDWKNYKLVIM